MSRVNDNISKPLQLFLSYIVTVALATAGTHLVRYNRSLSSLHPSVHGISSSTTRCKLKSPYQLRSSLPLSILLLDPLFVQLVVSLLALRFVWVQGRDAVRRLVVRHICINVAGS